ncbi:UDP-glycosyltransferase 87A2 [Helianthus annuus]|uniref:UDP-glycosyltransferase 87A2 n=1 Tax=Helianthus annuus TaxID=4232 RepID=UPI000B8F468F|nr:UDP-glycosyltransferase 87A2 [Helianthus annuus]
MVCTPKIRSLFPLDRIAKCLLLTTTYELEADAIDEIVNNTFIPVYVLGPNIPYFRIRTSFPSSKSSYYSWLESKPPRSVLYVSLGSLVRVENNQIAEILAGLKQSGVAFMWAAGGEALRLSGDYGSDGLVVERCDRLRVLSHSSVGGFISHCGWNSTKESLFSGVPLLTFPTRGDQAFNGKRVCEDWKVGRRLKTCNAFVSRDVVKDVVREFMGLEGDLRACLMEHVKRVEGICRESVVEGGQVEKEIDSFMRDSETNWLMSSSNLGLTGSCGMDSSDDEIEHMEAEGEVGDEGEPAYPYLQFPQGSRARGRCARLRTIEIGGM